MSDLSQKSVEMSFEGRVHGASAHLRAIGESRATLLDLDDTMAIYDPELIEASLSRALNDHAPDIDETMAEIHIQSLASSMHFGEIQKETLATTIGISDSRGFWQSYADHFDDLVEPDQVTFEPAFLKFVHFALRNSMEVGVISNALPRTGQRILNMLEDRSGIEFDGRAVFLGFGEARKPHPDALSVYQTSTGHTIDPSRTSYVGNSASDMRFAQRTGMIPVFLNHGNNAHDIAKTPKGQRIIGDSVVIDGFGALKNHLELNRPQYRRHISFMVDKPPSAHECNPDQETICLDPCDDAVYQVVHAGADQVMSYVPAIWHNFSDRFAQPASEFSVTTLPDYHHIFNEASGAIILPELDSDTDNGAQLRSYFTQNRTRDENGHVSSRGPLYYRQYIHELKGDGVRQLVFSKHEAETALSTIEQVSATNQNEHLALLGVEDNLRGNLQALYLSAINRWREEGATVLEGDDNATYKFITEKLEGVYERAVVLQYSHMLGLEYDRESLLTEIREGLDIIDDYSDFCQMRNIVPTFKSPEDDNALLIAARANYLCVQYPETTVLVGLTSGGVELAKVSQLFYRQLHNHDTRVINYPISVHNGLSMWSKDRVAPVNQATIDEAVGLPAVQDEKVVICEDNSNSGQTLQRVVNRVRELGADMVNFAVVEIDPTRVIMHHVQQKAGVKHNIGQAAEQARPVANYFHPDFTGAVGVVHILPQDQSFTKVIAMDTANRYNGVATTDDV